VNEAIELVVSLFLKIFITEIFMTIILPENYHIHSILEANRVTCIRREDAVRQDIRPMRIGVLHALPVDETFEVNILHPFGLSIIQV